MMISRVAKLCTVVLLASGLMYAGNGEGQDTSGTPASATEIAKADAGSSQQSPSAPQLQQRNPRYLVQKGDVIVLDFPFTPEFNETVTVQPDGFVSLRGLDDMHVEGMTTPQMQESLRKAYTKILHEPVVTVTLQSFVTPSFVAYGEVGKPGKYDLHGDTTVVQAIGIAGGFTGAAKHSQVYLFRRVSDDWVSAQKIDVKHMLKSGNLAEDLHLQPGDMLYVPKNTLSKLLTIQPLIPYNTFRLTFGPY
jgi:protein involved in polysaccharide export with SLBB domain